MDSAPPDLKSALLVFGAGLASLTAQVRELEVRVRVLTCQHCDGKGAIADGEGNGDVIWLKPCPVCHNGMTQWGPPP